MSKEANELEEKIAVEVRKSLLDILQHGTFREKLDAITIYFNGYGKGKPLDVARPLTFGQKG